MAESMSNPKINIKVTGTLTNTLDDGTGGSISQPTCSISPTLDNGISAGQCNRAWQRKDTVIAKDAQETIDLYDFVGVDIGAGAGRDGLGLPLTFEEIVTIVIANENAVTAAGILEILPANSQGWTPIGTHTTATGGALRGQGALIKYQTAEAGFDITDGANHRITLRAINGPVTVSIYILARHDDNESSSSSSSSVSASSISTSSSSISDSSSSNSSSNSSSSLSSQS